MGISLGMVEFQSISMGMECADAMLKASFVELISCKTTCPGKYIVMLKGEVAAVRASVEAAVREDRSGMVVDTLLIPGVDEAVCQAISGATEMETRGALGVMEFFCMSAAIQAADAAVKSADITLIEVRLGMGIGGKAFVTLCGDVSAVTEAVAVGIREPAEEGMLVASCVIPSADEALFASVI